MCYIHPEHDVKLLTFKTMKLEKGQIIEISNIPETENPIKAIVLDIIPNMVVDEEFCSTTYYTYILYAENKLFKMSNECQRGMNTSFTEDGEPISEMFEHWSDIQYNGIIVDNCIIPNLSLNI